MRFPQYHLATSVVNRVLDLANMQLTPGQALQSTPQLPDTIAQGEQLDAALSTPPTAVPAPAGSEEQVLLETQKGGTAADAVGGLAAMDAFI